MASIQCHKPSEEKTNYHHEYHYQKTEKCHDNRTSHDHKQHFFTDKAKDMFNHHDHHKSKDHCSTGTANHGLIKTEKKHGEHHEGHGFLAGHKGHDGHGAFGGHKGHDGHGFLPGHKGHEGHGAHGGHEGHCVPKIHKNETKKKKNRGDKHGDSSSEGDSSSDSDNEKKC